VRGRLGGSSHKLGKDKKALAVKLYHEKELPIMKICEMLEIGKPTLYKYVHHKKYSFYNKNFFCEKKDDF
jgi:hypothetical protein